MKVLLIGCAVCLSVVVDAQEKVPVFVRTAVSASGFTDPSKERQDSVRDLFKKLQDSASLRAVDSQVDAMITLEVLDRETKRETNILGRQNKSAVTVRLIAGEYSAEFTGESGSRGVMKGYGKAAEKVVEQLEVWTKANHERLFVGK